MCVMIMRTLKIKMGCGNIKKKVSGRKHANIKNQDGMLQYLKKNLGKEACCEMFKNETAFFLFFFSSFFFGFFLFWDCLHVLVNFT